VVSGALDRFGRIDALVNVAGAVPQADLFRMTDEEWDDGMALKFHGARRLTLHAWDALRQASGSVVFLSGSSAITPKASLAAVGSINAAISALSKAFAERGQPEGIQVNTVLPGPVMTDRRRSMLELYATSKGLGLTEAVEQFVKDAAISRYGMPEDIAALIAFLVHPSAHWMMGATLRMDGGEIKAV
jgi:3-oxoacyl-[acyl-carrier protein] reductase